MIKRVALGAIILGVGLASSSSYATVRVVPPTIKQLSGQWLTHGGGGSIYLLTLNSDGTGSIRVSGVRKTAEEDSNFDYELADCKLTGGALDCRLKWGDVGIDGKVIHGSVTYWSVDIVIPRTFNFRKRKLSFFRRSRLESAIAQFDE